MTLSTRAEYNAGSGAGVGTALQICLHLDLLLPSHSKLSLRKEAPNLARLFSELWTMWLFAKGKLKVARTLICYLTFKKNKRSKSVVVSRIRKGNIFSN